MAKICSVQVEILLTADEKALLDHYVKEQNQRYKKRGATRNWWTLERQPRDDRPALMMADQKEWRQEDVKRINTYRI